MRDATQSVDVHVPVRIAYDQWTRFVHREFDAEITEQRPDERLAWRTVGGGAQHAGVVTFQRLSDTDTRVAVRLDGEPDEHRVRTDAERFKDYVEHHGDMTAPSPQAQGDVINVLLGQHELVKALMARVQATDGEDKARAFEELTNLLRLHEVGEQAVVHPETRSEVADGRQVAGARVHEEGRADRAIAELREIGVGHPHFDLRFAQFRQAVLDHAAHEENEEFPRLRQQVPQSRLREMAGELVSVQQGVR